MSAVMFPKDLKEALSIKWQQDFIDTDSVGIKSNLTNLRRKPNGNFVFFMNYILVCGYGMGLNDIAVHVYRHPRFEGDVNADINEMLNFVRLGASEDDLVAGASARFAHGFFRIIPVNELIPRGWHIDIEFLHDRTSTTGINMSCMVVVKYQEFRSKPNEFGQLDQLLENTRFKRL